MPASKKPRQQTLSAFFAAKKPAKDEATTEPSPPPDNPGNDSTPAEPSPPPPSPSPPSGSSSEVEKRVRSPEESDSPRKRSKDDDTPPVGQLKHFGLPSFLVANDDTVLPTSTAHAKLIKSRRPRAKATWAPGQPVPYEFLCDCWVDISATGPRLEITTLLSECLLTVAEVTPEDVLPCIYLSVNKLAPEVEGLELGVGDSFLIKSIALSSSRTEAQVKELYKKEGDLAEIAQRSRQKQQMLVKPKQLTVRGIFNTLKDVAKASGKDVQKRRMERINHMLRNAKPVEANFIVRALQGKMRIGLALGTILVSIAHTFVVHELGESLKTISPEKLQYLLNTTSDRLRAVYHEVPSFDILVPALLSEGLHCLTPGKISLTPNLPVKPMLAKAAKKVSEVLERFSKCKFTCEFKYDGERAQIHFVKEEGRARVSIFSRNSENHTTKYPDVIDFLCNTPIIKEGVTSFILDSEVVAFEDGKIKPFQVLQHRGRKNIELKNVTIPVCLFAFDLLYLNGRSLIHESLEERRKLLYDSFTPNTTTFQFAKAKNCTEVEEMEAFLQDSIAGSCEGLIVKTLDKDSEYTPSKRSFNWLKLKKDYLEGVGDSLDLVPIGGYFGKGKRTGWYGGFLLACYDEDGESFQTTCKIGTGFSEEDLEAFTEFFKDKIVEAPPPFYSYDDHHVPDVWFKDCVVWEVRVADLSISPAHRAAFGLVDQSKGIAMRFPRFIRVRDDKTPTQATSARQVADMYMNQFQDRGEGDGAEDNDEDEEF